MTRAEVKAVKQLIKAANQLTKLEGRCGIAIGKYGSVGLSLGERYEKVQEAYDEATATLWEMCHHDRTRL